MNKLRFMQRMILLCSGILVLLGNSVAQAESNERYQAFVLQRSGGSSGNVSLVPSVFIIDSRDGHMWIWEKNMLLPSSDGDRGFGTLITYQGQVKPGDKIGDIVNIPRKQK